MSWIFIADDGEEVHYAVPPRVVELEQQVAKLKAELKEAERNRWGLASAYSDALTQINEMRKLEDYLDYVEQHSGKVMDIEEAREILITLGANADKRLKFSERHALAKYLELRDELEQQLAELSKHAYAMATSVGCTSKAFRDYWDYVEQQGGE